MWSFLVCSFAFIVFCLFLFCYCWVFFQSRSVLLELNRYNRTKLYIEDQQSSIRNTFGLGIWSTLLTQNVLQQRLREAGIKSCFSNSCSEKFCNVLAEDVWRISQQLKQLPRTSLVMGIVLYCKVLISCRDPTCVSICKQYFQLNILKILLPYWLAGWLTDWMTDWLT